MKVTKHKVENGTFTFETGNEEQVTTNTDYTKQFASQVSYEEFQELMKKAESIIGAGSNYSMENLLQYYGMAEMTYEEAMNMRKRFMMIKFLLLLQDCFAII